MQPTRESLDQWASARRPYLDNLKVALIAAIISFHAVLGYASLLEVWTYTEFREVSLSAATQIVLFLVLSPVGVLLMALLFLVAGLLTPPSHDRKGILRFVVDRTVRLGVPFLAYVLVVQPLVKHALGSAVGQPSASFWGQYPGEGGRLDTGPLWFVGVLLIFSLGYAGWRLWVHRRGRSQPPDPARPVSLRTLVLAAILVAPASFAVRLVYAYGSESGMSDLNFWEWPACLAAFVLGVIGSRVGWASSVPPGIARPCRTATLVAGVALGALLVSAGTSESVDDLLGGWGWPSAAFAVVDAVLTVFGSVWFLSVAQRRLDRRYRWGPLLGRSAYAAFMLQSLFLLALAVALRPVDLSAEVKALLVAVGGVVGSFWAGWLLVSRMPGASRVL